MTERLFRGFVPPIDDPDQGRRGRLIATATAVTALYLIGVSAVYAVGGYRTAMLIALSVAALAAVTHAHAWTGRLPAMELATAPYAARPALGAARCAPHRRRVPRSGRAAVDGGDDVE